MENEVQDQAEKDRLLGKRIRELASTGDTLCFSRWNHPKKGVIYAFHDVVSCDGMMAETDSLDETVQQFHKLQLGEDGWVLQSS